MDKMAREHGLGHWSCVSPRSNAMWVRCDGHEWNYWENDISRSWIDYLKEADKHYQPIGEDWQKPKYDLIEKRRAILLKDTLTDDDKKQLDAIADELREKWNCPKIEHALDAQAMDIIHRAAAIIKQSPTLVQKPFQYPCDGALYFTNKNREQVFLSGFLNSEKKRVVGKLPKDKAGSWTFFDAQAGSSLEGNADNDLIMYVWE